MNQIQGSLWSLHVIVELNRFVKRYLEGEDQMTELEQSLQIQPDADLMNSYRQDTGMQAS